MKRKLTALVLSMTVIASLFTSVSSYAYEDSDVETNIYVSTSGNDNNPGSEESPLATLDGARKKVREIWNGEKPINVIFKEGEYFFDKTVYFSRLDSGSESAPIIYKAENGKKVVFTGSKRIDASDFVPVTDKNILQKFYPEVRDKILQIDLNKQGISKEVYDWLYGRRELYVSNGWVMTPTSLFINDKRQEISRWPNDRHRVQEVEIIKKGGSRSGTTTNQEIYGNGSILKYKDSNIARWVGEKYIVASGFQAHPYFRDDILVKSVDPKELTVEFATWSTWGASTMYQTRGSCFYNILCELDIPGEYYIDVESGILYYYPPEDFKSDDVVEIGYSQSDFININELSNVTFDGFEMGKNSVHWGGRMFDHQNYYDGNIIVIEKGNKLTIRNCCFRDVGHCAILGFEVTNSTIENNEFYHIGIAAVTAAGGNTNNIIPSGNVIQNNHIAKTSEHQYTNRYGAITLAKKLDGFQRKMNETVGTVVRNNVVHNTENSALDFQGVRHEIYENEFYECQKDRSDAGAIYGGTVLSDYGLIVRDNYIHDIGMQASSWRTTGIYLDGYESGAEIYRNIFVPNNEYDASAVFINGGIDLTVKNNIMVNGERSFADAGDTHESSNTVSNLVTMNVLPFRSKEFVNEFPDIIDTYNSIDNTRYNGTYWYDRNSKFEGNVAVASEIHSGQAKVRANVDAVRVRIPDYDESLFVNAAKQDYRLTDETKKKYNITAEVPGEDYDIDKIGIQTNYQISEELKKFRLLGPYDNSQTEDPAEVKLSWEESIFADEYDWYVAEDPQMEKLVDWGTTTLGHSAEAHNLKPSHTYYWTVNAKIKSRQFGEIIPAEKVFTFATNPKGTVNTVRLNNYIRNLEELLPNITEGNKSGNYIEGTINEINSLLDKANNFRNMVYGDQTEVDGICDELVDYYDNIDVKKVHGYSKINIDKNKIKLSTKGVEIEDGCIHLTEESSGNIIIPTKTPTADAVCFDVWIDDKNGWEGNRYFAFTPYGHVDYSIWSSNAWYWWSTPSGTATMFGSPSYAFCEDPNVFKQREWNKVIVANISLGEGVFIYCKVNDTVLYAKQIKDAEKFTDGNFIVYKSGNIDIKIKTPDTIPEGIFDPYEHMDGEGLGGITIFKDLDGYEWAKKDIEALQKSGIIKGFGDNNFAPGEKVTKGQAAVILMSAFEKFYDPRENSAFNDLEKNHWAYKYVSSAVNRGVMVPKTKELFGVDDGFTREDVAYALHQIGYKMGFAYQFNVKQTNFVDWQEVSEDRKNAVGFIAGRKIMIGYPDGSFKPKETVTRAEIVKLVNGLLTNTWYVEGGHDTETIESMARKELKELDN